LFLGLKDFAVFGTTDIFGIGRAEKIFMELKTNPVEKFEFKTHLIWMNKNLL
jgi:hypothetical protein